MLRFKHLFVTIGAVILCILSAGAQPRDSKRFAAIESEKIAYITKELNLTPAEAQRFFPIYNQYSKEVWAIRSQKKENASTTTPSPRGVNSFNRSDRSEKRDVLSYDAKELDIKKEYRKKFAEVIGSARASQFFEVEQNFRELLYKELQRRNR
ncbi:hypothetical protein FXV77_03005 [Sphingobacterium phlebotomi]|uniref:DUF4168 domain-containing protein n=1 Tax=Sphingobacterium phlebotomi TaxID=2605433 RepID=A0A5D4HCH1_9SPHI|nr:hypothetical protein [Sphingobacterium phlebotomi]TYR38264.1 hypothetical protein FXV77_03005 [Sphingobacterium phlebotomi]